MNKKDYRKTVVTDLINSGRIKTQSDLIDALKVKGVNVTQATLSRDLKEVGAVKSSENGLSGYRIPVRNLSSKTGLSVEQIDISGQLCVLHVHPGFASAIASVVDHSSIKGVMGTIAGDDTVMLALTEGCDTRRVKDTLKNMFDVSEITVRTAGKEDTKYAEAICEEIFISSQERKTGIARRTPEYIKEKMLAGKAVIAIADNGDFAGFSYIESWGGKSFVANSGLIVAHKYRGLGIARRIKEQTFILSRTLFPDAKIFSITTGAAVMKMNYEFGFRPVPFTELTEDPEFWKGCEGCRHFDILTSHDYKMCICTGLLFDPKEHLEIHNPDMK